jgi:hypothetical protein
MDSRKHATPSTGSAHNGPCWVEIWKPVRMLSSKRRADREEWREFDVSLALAGVEAPVEVGWSAAWNLS